MEAPKVTLKLLIYQPQNQVLFAEAGKDFVDFLFGIHTLPLGTVTNLLTTKNMPGSLGNIYKSIETLDASYMQPNQTKDPLLNPKSSGSQAPLLMPKSIYSSSSSTTIKTRDLYKCPYYYQMDGCGIYVAEDPDLECPSCNGLMSCKATYIAPPPTLSSSPSSTTSFGDEGGFVKDVMTYMVMDDLVVKPMSTISSITLLNQFNVKDLGSLQEKVVELGVEEGMELLKASLKSKTVLTDVFFGKK